MTLGAILRVAREEIEEQVYITAEKSWVKIYRKGRLGDKLQLGKMRLICLGSSSHPLACGYMNCPS